MITCLTASDFADLIEGEESASCAALRSHLENCAACHDLYQRLLAAQHLLETSGLLVQSRCTPPLGQITQASDRFQPLLAAESASGVYSLFDRGQIRLLRELIRPACGEPASKLLIEEAVSRASRVHANAGWNDFLRLFADLFSELCGETAGRMVLLCAQEI